MYAIARLIKDRVIKIAGNSLLFVNYFSLSVTCKSRNTIYRFKSYLQLIFCIKIIFRSVPIFQTICSPNTCLFIGFVFQL